MQYIWSFGHPRKIVSPVSIVPICIFQFFNSFCIACFIAWPFFIWCCMSDTNLFASFLLYGSTCVADIFNLCIGIVEYGQPVSILTLTFWKLMPVSTWIHCLILTHYCCSMLFLWIYHSSYMISPSTYSFSLYIGHMLAPGLNSFSDSEFNSVPTKLRIPSVSPSDVLCASVMMMRISNTSLNWDILS